MHECRIVEAIKIQSILNAGVCQQVWIAIDFCLTQRRAGLANVGVHAGRPGLTAMARHS